MDIEELINASRAGNLAAGTDSGMMDLGEEAMDPASADARAHVDARLATLAPELRQAITASFGLDGGTLVSASDDLIGRALAQLRLERSMGETLARQAWEQVQVA